ncbi:hypothetical protein D9619_011481 [Psilocybe cf. subviscida]|uniref:Uncharacterized protein n=1 Tax=Psilocybe cf. subviscida TaxID=2480587 RepID=A0A8H5FA11_9AGAR|nr:hypothetical protein D9619_011481 [Psilocybe cf. subviscida]
MGHDDTLPALQGTFRHPICSAQPLRTEPEEDNAPTPTHNAEQCEICQLHLQHLSIPRRSHYPNTPPYAESFGAALTTPPAQSFEDGVKLGLRLQKESDDILLNQYRKRLMRAEAERDISRRSQYEVERLERELAETKDMLLAVHISYEESVEAHTSAQSESYDSSEPAVFEERAGTNADSASRLTLDRVDLASDHGQVNSITNDEAGDAIIEPGGVYSSLDAHADFEDDDDDDLFMWEQLKALDEGDKEEFWKSVYNIKKQFNSTPEHRPRDLDSANNAEVKSLASTDDVQSETGALDDFPSLSRANESNRNDDHHSDGEESSYSFI